jgi:hypothetical protein
MELNRYPASVMAFASTKGDESFKTDYAEAFADYYAQYSSINGQKKWNKNTNKFESLTFSTIQSYEEKEKLLHKQFMSLVAEASNQPNMLVGGISDMMWATNPTVVWATYALISATIDMVLPQTMINSLGFFADVRNIGWGDTAVFNLKPRDLFIVSKAGRSQTHQFGRKQFNTTVTLNPENQAMTVMVSLYRVLAGFESLADFTAKAIRSLESQVTVDAYSAFNTAMAALDNAGDDALRFAGYTQDKLVALAQRLTAWNGGAKPQILGTKRALVNILPDDVNYRYDLESDYVKVGYIRTLSGLDIIELEQVADWTTEFKISLDDTKIYLLCSGIDKPVKVVLEGNTMATTDGVFDNANLTQKASFQKAWKAGVITNSLAGVITLS